MSDRLGALVTRVAKAKGAIAAGASEPDTRIPSVSTVDQSPAVWETNRATRRLQKIQVLILLNRGWHYLRYLDTFTSGMP